ncbi:MAG: hypothetical protein BGO21_11125 [Dyadobacter sp. 50-39]|uniref:TonB-dependent receptor n=1 Tax=Dyadobacter sp. 50-39 TaxID=1895756 RepID=UPI0009625E5E|nr:TonB-dependent receptor [Dyadobacter sp. 50-39]OJV19941.1 MAG: hypothetical protein BGO21_11125 [Dyadobacter sp. 50-39]
MIRIFLLFLLSLSIVHAQEFTSIVRGSVKDADSGLPLAKATVQLDDQGSTTDDAGQFRFEGVGVGRHVLKVSFVGYQTLVISELLLESGKENVQEVRLSVSGGQLQEATVSGSRPPAFNSVQAITPEQTLRYAATYLDPARVATSFPGVAAANDQANGLVVRGNSPNSMQWRLEGVEIVNPNHLSNAGTFSDRPTSTGGGVNILSTQLLAASHFLAGPFPAQYGNVTGAILDMNLRKGNGEQTEYTAQASLLGLDFAVEGPFSKTSKASYLVNYRYSFTGLLGAMGVKFGGEDIRFQDLSFNINLPDKRGGNLTIFGMGGVSSNDFKGETDSTLWKVQKDGYNILYKNEMGAMGITYTIPVSRKASFRMVGAFSGLRTSRDSNPIFEESQTTPALAGDDDIQIRSSVSVSAILTVRNSAKSRLKVGSYLTYRAEKLNGPYAVRDFDTRIVQPFISWNYQLTPAITTEIGLHAMASLISEEDKFSHSSLEPRAAIRWQVSERGQLSFSYGLHSQMQTPQLYAADYSKTGISRGNLDLGPSRSNQYVLGYQHDFGKSGSLKLEAYWQQQFQIPVNQDARFSVVNQTENIVFLPLENRGKARNIGMEVTYQKLLTDSYYLLISGSVYDATYTLGDGVRRDSRYNGRHTFSLTGGKEIKGKRGGLWGINAKVLWLGGFRDVQVNEQESRKYHVTVYTDQYVYNVKMKDYFRPDLRIYWKKGRPGFSRTLALDLQNVSATRNEAYRFYDNVKGRVVTQKQLGLIPVISYRWEF